MTSPARPRPADADAPGGDGVRRLVVVESPAKAKTIAQYLGDGWTVEASVGHVRDLPQRKADLPEKHRRERWADLGVDVYDSFQPFYVVSPDRRAQVTKLKKLLAQADELWLATDEDREGEAISWHLLETLKPKVPVRRMVFNEITREAVRRAAANPRQLDTDLVAAQETRRVLDRLYGYEVSPVLWRRIGPKTSAGRVQSVATRLVVERERERMAFRSGSWWDVSTTSTTRADADEAGEVVAAVTAVDGTRVASGRDFDAATGRVKDGTQVLLLDEQAAQALSAGLAEAVLEVADVERRPYTRKPYAPFRTSTLQQEASRKLRFSAQRTMQVAQRLYESGHITYMRTDSQNLSADAVALARAAATSLYGAASVPERPRVYGGKAKNAQEAHEAIRPAGEFLTPGELSGRLDRDQARLYELVWQRAVASQMVDARGESVAVRLTTSVPDGRRVDATARGRTITEPGFLQAYVESTDDGGTVDDEQRRLPRLAVGQALDVRDVEAKGHETSPPARYTEASLVKRMEELGIGRPSTYASILSTVVDRGYVSKRGSALVPAWLAFTVVNLMEGHFRDLVDYGFTADVEDDLDAIARGEADRVAWLSRFYWGDEGPEAEQESPAPAAPDGHAGAASGDGTGLRRKVGHELGLINARALNTHVIGHDDAGRVVQVRVGRYGPYVERVDPDTAAGPDDGPSVAGAPGGPDEGGPAGGGTATEEATDETVRARASVPPDLAPDELTVDVAVRLLEDKEAGDTVLGQHPDTGADVVVKAGRFGPYVETAPDVDGGKPRRSSLLRGMEAGEVDLATALRLLSLPRVLGQTADGDDVVVDNGRYGPYVRGGKETRSLASEDELFTVTLAEAQALLAQPKQRGRRAAAPPLRELGTDPETEAPVVLKEGRFGPYVTDGTTNASLRTGDDAATISHERAYELLAERRAKGPGTKKPAAKKPAAKKPAAKKPAARKGTAKPTAAGAAQGPRVTTVTTT